jgi:hypothetical protein
MRRAARVDANQRQIIAALEAAGASVEVLGLPLDLLVGAGGRWMLMEVKATEYESRRPSDTRKRQREFAERHPNGGPVATVWDVEGALRALATLRG